MLPPELWSEVCLNLSLRDVFQLSHVNKFLYSHVTDTTFKIALTKHNPLYSLSESPYKTWKECAMTYLSRDVRICPDVTMVTKLPTHKNQILPRDFVSLSDTSTQSLLSVGQSISVSGSILEFPELNLGLDLQNDSGNHVMSKKSRNSYENRVFTSFYGIKMTLSPEIHANMTVVESPFVLAVLTGWGFNYQKLLVKYKSSSGLEPDYIGEHINQLDRVFVCSKHVFLKSVSNWTYLLSRDTFIPVVFQPQSTSEYPFLLCYNGLVMFFSGTSVEIFHIDLQNTSVRGGKSTSFTHSHSGFSGNLYKLIQCAEHPQYAVEYNINRTICGVWNFEKMTYTRRPFADHRNELQLVGIGQELGWWVYTKEWLEGRLEERLEVEEEVEEEYGDL